MIGTTERELPIYQLKEFGFIHNLWIEPDFRQVGLAQQMVKMAIEHFRPMGVQQIRLDTATPNQAARDLFEKCGFRPSTITISIVL